MDFALLLLWEIAKASAMPAAIFVAAVATVAVPLILWLVWNVYWAEWVKAHWGEWWKRK